MGRGGVNTSSHRAQIHFPFFNQLILFHIMALNVERYPPHIFYEDIMLGFFQHLFRQTHSTISPTSTSTPTIHSCKAGYPASLLLILHELLTFFKKVCILFSLLSSSASSLCRPIAEISCVSCSRSMHNAAFRSAPSSLALILSISSFRHSKIYSKLFNK